MLPLSSVLVASLASSVCSVRELRDSEQYRWRVERIAEFVDSAHVIVRARATSEDSALVSTPRGTFSQTAVRFTTIEVLRGPVPSDSLVFPGEFVERDDFNAGSVPYQMVRRAGQRGFCFASEYRRGAEYLLVLRRSRTGLTIRWVPLAPLNEQVHGADDPWVQWVRERVTSRRERRTPNAIREFPRKRTDE